MEEMQQSPEGWNAAQWGLLGSSGVDEDEVLLLREAADRARVLMEDLLGKGYGVHVAGAAGHALLRETMDLCGGDSENDYATQNAVATLIEKLTGSKVTKKEVPELWRIHR